MNKLLTYNAQYDQYLVNSLIRSYTTRTNKDLLLILERPAFAETYDAAFEVLRRRGHFEEVGRGQV